MKPDDDDPLIISELNIFPIKYNVWTTGQQLEIMQSVRKGRHIHSLNI